MTSLQAVFLGLLLGLTEFFPISSSGHLALAELLFDVPGAGRTFEVLARMGTMLAVFFVLWSRVLGVVRGGLASLTRRPRRNLDPDRQDFLFVLVATVPLLVITPLLHGWVEGARCSPLWIGLGLMLTSAVLVTSSRISNGSIEHPPWTVALCAGAALSLASFPGISGSAVTIVALLGLGVRRQRAFELGILLLLPATLLGVIFAGWGAFLEIWRQASLGALVAFGVGVSTLRGLRRVVDGGAVPWFALWVLPLGFATLGLAYVWP